MTVVLLPALAAVVPSLLLLWFFSSRDRFPEPPLAIWTTFGLGVLTIIPAVLLETVLEGAVAGELFGSARAAYMSFVVAALVEESLKLSVLLLYSFRSRHFDEPMDGIVYGAASGLGFATLENLLYVLSPDGGLGVGALRAFLSVPGHALWGAILGFHAASGKLEGRSLAGCTRGLLAAVVLHGLYDFPVMMAGSGRDIGAASALALLLLLLGVSAAAWFWVMRMCHTLRSEQIAGLRPRCAGATPVAPAASQEEAGADGPGRRGHRGAAVDRLAGSLLVVVGGLLVAWALVTAAAVLSTRGDDGVDGIWGVVGWLIVGGIPAAAGVPALTAGLRRLRRASASCRETTPTAETVHAREGGSG